jgi:regulator of sigma E protease
VVCSSILPYSLFFSFTKQVIETYMSGVLLSIVGFLVMIGLLIFIHELGHFLVAKLFGVYVEVFSIGLVGSIVSFRWGETEYRLGWLPLGGYVKMLGEGDSIRVPEELQPRAFANKPLWQRSLVVLAGPLANLFVLPIMALVVLFGAQTNELSTVIGTVMPNRPAQQAGLLPGDTILSVDGHETRYFYELLSLIGNAHGRKVKLKIQRGKRVFDVSLKPVTHVQYDLLNTPQKRGIIGIIAAHRRPEIGISSRSGPAYRAGLRTWDVVTAVDGKAITRWEQLVALLHKAPGTRHKLTIKRPVYFQGTLMEHRTYLPPQTIWYQANKRADGTYDYGFGSSEMVVRKVLPGTPLHKVGVRPGDRMVKLAGKPLKIHSDFSAVPRKKDRKYTVTFMRNGKLVTRTFLLKPVAWTDQFNQTHRRLMLGAELSAPYERGTLVSINGRFRHALTRAVDETWRLNVLIVRAVGTLFSRDFKTESIGGPIMIFQIAKRAVKRGWEVFIRHMVLISINLGLLNLLPIPVLDGGHLMFFLFEGVTRKPVPPRIRNAMLLVGFAILLMLMMLAFRNDIKHFFLM